MKNTTFISSILCAINGFIHALKTEKNYKYYIIITAIILAINFYIKVEVITYILQIINTAGVFSAECLNTSIERLCNIDHKEISPEIKIVKDVAASSILCWGISFFACEIIMICRHMIK